MFDVSLGSVPFPAQAKQAHVKKKKKIRNEVMSLNKAGSTGLFSNSAGQNWWHITLFILNASLNVESCQRRCLHVCGERSKNMTNFTFVYESIV